MDARKVILLFLLLVAFTGCKSSQELPGFSHESRTTEQSEKKDSIVYKERLVPYPVPGNTVYRNMNIDSLRQAFQAGTAPQYITVTDKKGLTELQTRINLLTGQLESECRTRDSVIYAQQTEMYRFQSQVMSMVKEVTEVDVKAAKGKSWLEQILSWPALFIFFVGVVTCIYWIVKLWCRIRWPWRKVST